MSPLSTVILALFMLLVVQSGKADDMDSYYFRRNAKWISLAPSGGSLVSGRGNFRPGFYGRGGSAAYMGDPVLFKRSQPADLE
ncbi:unnamed protein product [Bursaphelenchus xylophilus]|uniref:(pine wood nematode) hypothetical protein n=1 Tax=Bursaphelenchus xylophilus TaxID=6326 RepID=A0A1I7SGZ1_BURXY|nr:unnamed protein product [Bursaphelenchus xylophilus]CAG9115212.1 unnamed protein product [Bursaphelenchus xylophilus]